MISFLRGLRQASDRSQEALVAMADCQDAVDAFALCLRSPNANVRRLGADAVGVVAAMPGFHSHALLGLEALAEADTGTDREEEDDDEAAADALLARMGLRGAAKEQDSDSESDESAAGRATPPVGSGGPALVIDGGPSPGASKAPLASLIRAMAVPRREMEETKEIADGRVPVGFRSRDLEAAAKEWQLSHSSHWRARAAVFSLIYTLVRAAPHGLQDRVEVRSQLDLAGIRAA